MAKQATATKKTTKTPVARSKSTSATKTTVRTVPAQAAVRSQPHPFVTRFHRHLTPNALVGEVVGTYILALVTLGAVAPLGPLYVALSYLVLSVIIGSISGSHLNPAVSFGLWTARRFSGFALPFYWLAQFIGAFAALLSLAALTGKGLALDLTHFFSSLNWGVFSIEVIGTAILLFGFTAAISRPNLSSLGRSFGIGLSLFVALVASTSLFTSLNNSIDKTKIQSLSDVPRVLRLDGPVLNPAIALGAKEKTDNELQGSSNDGTEKPASRLTLGETVVGSLLGAAIGANLYRLIARRDRRDEV